MSETTFEGIRLTEPAVNKLKVLLETEQTDLEIRLRLYVEPGGCSGLRYDFFPDETLNSDDVVYPFDGVEVVVDKKSLPYLDGSTLDWEDTVMRQRFVIDNPNAQGTCACGDSFN
ncbi:MAG: hypothetical protein RIT51_782 [Actinomycetota bacterium]|jgi:iron-sulfur cluster assembly accessory protein